MSQPVEQRRRHLGIPEHVPPFSEAQVGRDHQTRAFIEFPDEVEQ